MPAVALSTDAPHVTARELSGGQLSGMGNRHVIKTLEELDRIRDECHAMVTSRSGLSAAAAAIPLPGVDIAADLGLLSELIPAINRKFGLTPEQIDDLSPELKQRLAVIITSVGSTLIGSYVTRETVVILLKKVGVRVASKSVTKYIPFVGSAISATVSFAAMKWMGNSHITDCYDVMKRIIQEEPA